MLKDKTIYKTNDKDFKKRTATPVGPHLIEIARSYSRKYNLGNYESQDFFCSAKEEVPADEIKATSKRLFQFCKEEVEKSLDAIIDAKLDKAVDMGDNWKKSVGLETTTARHEREAKEDEIRIELIKEK